VAAPPICGNCGSALPRAAMVCPRCGRPVYLLRERRALRRRNASVVGMAGALLMGLQSAFMLVGGAIALVALSIATRGDLSGARGIADVAAIFVGLTLLFDLVGVSLLIVSFHHHTRAARAETGLAGPDSARHSLAFYSLLATLFLALWLLVTLAWRGALAAIVSFYPTPFSGAVQLPDLAGLRRAASIMLGLWAAAAFLLFLGAVFGTRFLMRTRGVPLTFPRLLWPLETLVHAGAACAILVLAPGLLTSLQIEVSTLGLIQTLGVIELLVVPILGLLAYAFLFHDFLRLYRSAEEEGRESRAAPVAPAPADPPAGEG